MNLKSIDLPPERGTKSLKPLLALLAVPAINVIYLMQNRAGETVHSLVSDVDRNFPFVPEFAVPYLLWYPFLFAVFVAVLRRNEREYYRTLVAMCIGLLLSNLTFLLFQTTVPRPPLDPSGPFERMVAFVYSADEPFNCFPSTHVLTTAVVLFGSRVLNRWVRIPVLLFGASIIASTLFIKQHVVADLLGGLLAALLAYRLAGAAISLYGRRRLAPTNRKRLEEKPNSV